MDRDGKLETGFQRACWLGRELRMSGERDRLSMRCTALSISCPQPRYIILIGIHGMFKLQRQYVDAALSEIKSCVR